MWSLIKIFFQWSVCSSPALPCTSSSSWERKTRICRRQSQGRWTNPASGSTSTMRKWLSTSNNKYSLQLLSTYKDSLLQTRPLALFWRCWPLLHIHVHPNHRRGHQIQRQKQDCCFLGDTAKYWFRINIVATVVIPTDFTTFRFCFVLEKSTKTVPKAVGEIWPANLSLLGNDFWLPEFEWVAFSCPGQLNRWPCHSVSSDYLSQLTFDFVIKRQRQRQRQRQRHCDWFSDLVTFSDTVDYPDKLNNCYHDIED